MKKLLTALIIILPLIAIEAKAKSDDPYKEITAEQLLKMQKTGSVVVIDSRGGKYFDGEIIAGATHLSVKDTNEETLEKAVPSKNSGVVFYCTNTACQASALSAYKAANAGYTSLYKYSGGIEEWKERGFPTVRIN